MAAASIRTPVSSSAMSRAGLLTRRALFATLLASAPLLPPFGNAAWTFPDVQHLWVLAPLGALFLVALAQARPLLCLRNLDLLALLAFGASLGLWRHSVPLALVCIYTPLLYLGARMALAVRTQPSRDPSGLARAPLAQGIPTAWLIVGIAVLAIVQANWTLGAGTTTDVGPASVAGAHALIEGRAVYGIGRAQLRALGSDPHYDTYGPVVYESYVPFVALAGGGKTPARWAALAFTLLTAALLYRLGSATRSRRAGVLLAFAWLSFPLTLYAGRLASNDALVAATLVGTLLAASSPSRRGAAAALASLTKFTPLALVPVLIASSGGARRTRAGIAWFSGAFLLTGAVVLVPVLLHASPSTFLARTVGFQLTRSPGFTVWEELDYLSGSGAPWLHSAGAIVHGLAIACVGAYALALARVPRAPGVAGLAAACAAVLIGVELCDGYFLLSYTLWFVPLVLSAAILGGPPPLPERGRQAGGRLERRSPSVDHGELAREAREHLVTVLAHHGELLDANAEGPG